MKAIGKLLEDGRQYYTVLYTSLVPLVNEKHVSQRILLHNGFDHRVGSLASLLRARETSEWV